MAILVRTEGSHQGKWVYPLGRRCVLGRTPECDISDVFAGNTTASRLHAVLELVGERYIVEDSGSRNGTYVNGQRVTGRVSLAMATIFLWPGSSSNSSRKVTRLALHQEPRRARPAA
jgi:pSer/pThr/pTyr-binding forkhead associated (FHA) protein